ncbi:tRNA (guanosine(46)-N7)-methyltransferase TrmB [Lachnospiraceae bacterium ZAX-1]
MRLRNIPGSKERIAENIWCVQIPNTHKGKWHDFFLNNNPIHIEIGMGKGQFVMNLAKEHPDINYLGIEKYSSVLLRALQKMEVCPLNNLRFIRIDAETIVDIFDLNEIEHIYLNFSDPWPKDRHAKRRLTSKEFFSRYHKILSSDGVVEFKTDNSELFYFSLDEIKLAGWRLKVSTEDLHHDAMLSIGNVMTEYEEKFSAIGNPIYKLVAYR